MYIIYNLYIRILLQRDSTCLTAVKGCTNHLNFVQSFLINDFNKFDAKKDKTGGWGYSLMTRGSHLES